MTKIAYLTTGGLSPAAKPKVTSEFEIHAADCSHVKRREADGAYAYFTDVDDVEAFVEAEVAVYTDQDQGWTEDDFRIFPCVHEVKAPEPEVTDGHELVEALEVLQAATDAHYRIATRGHATIAASDTAVYKTSTLLMKHAARLLLTHKETEAFMEMWLETMDDVERIVPRVLTSRNKRQAEVLAACQHRTRTAHRR